MFLSDVEKMGLVLDPDDPDDPDVPESVLHLSAAQPSWKYFGGTKE